MKKQIDQKSGHGCQIYNVLFQKILCVTILLFWCTRIFTANIFHRVATLKFTDKVPQLSRIHPCL